MLACVDGGLLCVPALIAGASALGLFGWLKFGRTADCEDHCDHCPGEHEDNEA